MLSQHFGHWVSYNLLGISEVEVESEAGYSQDNACQREYHKHTHYSWMYGHPLQRGLTIVRYQS